jgi:hypothetical protein
MSMEVKLVDANGHPVDVENGALVIHDHAHKRYAVTGTYAVGAGDTVLWLRNDDQNKKLVVDWVVLASDTASEYELHFPQGTTAAGTAVTPVGIDRTNAEAPAVTAIRNETGNTQANVFHRGFVAANIENRIPSNDSIVLGYLDELGIDLDTAAAASANATIVFHMEG